MSVEPPAREPAPPARAPTATVSSLKSDHSTEQLICNATVKNIKPKSVTSKSVEAGSDGGAGSRKGSGGGSARRLVVWLGLAQVVLGALLVGGGALAVVKGAALARAGAGLWAGCLALVAGVVGVLAGINDCYGLNHPTTGGPLLTAFMVLSLLCLAGGNSAAVLAATGLQRDALRSQPLDMNSFQDEMAAWTPVLSNISVLIVAALDCLVSIVSILHVARRVCACLRPKQPFDHNQFAPGTGDENGDADTGYKQAVAQLQANAERARELCKELEGQLQGETIKRKESEPEYGSANSKEKLVTRWLGHQVPPPPQRPRRPAGVRKPRKHPPPVVLLPAHPASTLGRMPPYAVVGGPRYATLPLPPAPYAHALARAPPHAPPHAPLYYPIHDTRARRRRSPRDHRERRRRGGRERDSQLTRSLERIHRKRRADRDRPSDADLKRTYTGLDREYAEQFIAVCDETRQAHAHEQHDSLASSSDLSHTSHSSAPPHTQG